MAPRYTYSLVACARWEASELRQWVEYHRSIGFDHIYIYSNDDEPTAQFAEVSAYVYGPAPFVTFYHWSEVGAQRQMYLHFLENFREETEWFSFIDIDEFLVLKNANNIHDFMRAFRDRTDCLYFNWICFGHAGRVEREREATLLTYLWRANALDAHTKVLCRSSLVDPDAIRKGMAAGFGPFYHFLGNYGLPGLRCHNVLQDDVCDYGRAFPSSTERVLNKPGVMQAMLNTGYIAHFQFKSEADFLRRWGRGGLPQATLWREVYDSGGYKQILKSRNEVYDSYLAEYWYHYTKASLRFSAQHLVATPRFDNVALNKPAWQSSILPPTAGLPPGAVRVGGGNDGIRRGNFGFHTQLEGRPWWMVDLLGSYEIVEVHIYNCWNDGQPPVELNVFGSDNGTRWVKLCDPRSLSVDAHGLPLIIRLARDALCRFVLIRLTGRGCLHLDEVEVYGQRSAIQIPVLGTALTAAALADVD